MLGIDEDYYVFKCEVCNAFVIATSPPPGVDEVIVQSCGCVQSD